jgi:hypothetical protein
MVLLSFAIAASAASCPPEPLHEVVARSADAFLVTLDKELPGLFPTVEATVVAVYGGCTRPGDTVQLVFSPDDDARPTWTLGRTYAATTVEAFGDQHTVELCGLWVDEVFLRSDQRAYLESRPIVCGGVTTCQDGSAPAECPDTCAEVTCPDAACGVNPCAGCALEVFDRQGAPQLDADADGVCDAADECPGDDRADADGDTVCDALDACAEGDDRQDADRDGVPDACEAPLDDTGPGPGAEPTTPRIGGGGGGCRCDAGGGGGAWPLWPLGGLLLSRARRPRAPRDRGTRAPSGAARPRG